MGHVLVIAAVYEEIEALTDSLAQKVHLSIGKRSVIKGVFKGIDVLAAVTGPGMVNTAQAVTACIEKMGPSLMIQIGCGGGFRQKGMRVGDIAVASKEIDVHLGVEKKDGGLFPDELSFHILKMGERQWTNEYELDERLSDLAVSSLKAFYDERQVSVFKGNFITASTVTGSDERGDFLYRTFSPCIESMEGSASAFLSIFYGIPFLEIRCVSNLVEKRDKSKWNLPLSCFRAGEAAAIFLNTLKNNWPAEK